VAAGTVLTAVCLFSYPSLFSISCSTDKQTYIHIQTSEHTTHKNNQWKINRARGHLMAKQAIYIKLSPRPARSWNSKGNGQFWGVSSQLTMHCNAFAANGMGLEGGDGNAQRGPRVIYDCLVTVSNWFILILMNIIQLITETTQSTQHTTSFFRLPIYLSSC